VDREFAVRFPPAIEDGSVRRVQGAGEAGRHGAPSGDLYIVVRVRPHPLLSREGHDIVCEVPISVGQAALGATIEAPSLEGKVRLKVPAGTQSGRVFRLRGKGVPHGSARGDQRVRILVETPVVTSDRQRALVEALEAGLALESYPQREAYQAKMRELYGE